MASQTYSVRFPDNWSLSELGIVIVGLVVVYWTSTEYQWFDPSLSLTRAVTGILLVGFVPGALLTNVLGVGRRSVTEFVLFAVGLSVASVSLLTVALSVAGPVLGVERPLSLPVFGVALVGGLSVLSVATWQSEVNLDRFAVTVSDRPWTLVGVALLPALAALASMSMNRFGSNVPMYAFFLVVAAIVVLAAAGRVYPSQYAAVVFTVGLSVFLHRSLLTQGVVGADIQFESFLAQYVFEMGVWSPDLGGSLVALPVVTSVPAVFAATTGLPVPTLFKGVYVLLFAFVPLGMFALGRTVFDDRTAFFASLVFVFYHGSFYFTPGKQLVSELFLVLLLLLYFRYDLGGVRTKVTAVLLGVGLVHSHYGTTYLFALSLLVATVSLLDVGNLFEEVDHGLLLSYPLVFFVGATGWYAYSSAELTRRLAATLSIVVDQLLSLLHGTVAGSGASYVRQQTGLLEVTNVVLYLALTGLLGLGVVVAATRALVRVYRGRSVEHVEYVALAVPFFAFLGSSYFVTANLWADRVYQLTLVVLAPFVPIGYLFGTMVVTEAGARFELPSVNLGRWSPLACLLVALLLFNSGLAFAAAGQAQTSSFESDAHDLAFSAPERDSAEWVSTYVPAASVGSYTAGAYPDSERVPVYTDSRTQQLLRSTMPHSYTETDVRLLKSQWEPRLHPNRLDEGYVFVRERGVLDANGERVPVSFLTVRERAEITDEGSVVHTNGAVTVVLN